MGRGAWWFRLVVGLLALGAVATLAAFAYGAGYSDGSVSGARDVPGWFYGGPFVGWHIVGFLIGLIIFFLVIRLVFGVVFGFGHRHGPWGYRYYGAAPWGSGPNPGAGNPGAPEDPNAWHGSWHHGWRGRAWEARQAYLEDWHRQAHGAAQQSPGSTGQAGGPGTSGTTAGGPDKGANG